MALHGLEIQREFAAPDVPIIEHPAEARLSPAGVILFREYDDHAREWGAVL